MVNAQEWLDQNYPKEKRKKPLFSINTDDNFGNRRLNFIEGCLNLRDFANLKNIFLSSQQITSLNASDFASKLIHVELQNNSLSGVDFLLQLCPIRKI